MDLAQLTRDLEDLRSEALAQAAAAPDSAALEALEVELLGKKGRLTGVLRGIGALPADDRPRVGAVANTTREAIEAALLSGGHTVRRIPLEPPFSRAAKILEALPALPVFNLFENVGQIPARNIFHLRTKFLARGQFGERGLRAQIRDLERFFERQRT